MIEESGLLLRDGGAFVLRRDEGGTYMLRLSRVPVDLVGKRVRLTGTLDGPEIVDVAGVRAA